MTITISGEKLPNLGVLGETKYLGLKFTAAGIVPDSLKIVEQITELTKAPLKPAQRMHILRTNVLPGALHLLALGVHRRGTLRRVDQQVRAAVRAWLYLPKDIPVCVHFFFSKPPPMIR